MLESRSAEMADSIVISGAATKSAAAKEVSGSVDRLIYYAGWADKYEQVLGNTNPVAGPFFNFTVAEAMGIVGIIADSVLRFGGEVNLEIAENVIGRVVELRAERESVGVMRESAFRVIA